MRVRPRRRKTRLLRKSVDSQFVAHDLGNGRPSGEMSQRILFSETEDRDAFLWCQVIIAGQQENSHGELDSLLVASVLRFTMSQN
jgi:hypothetical protein